MPASRSKQALTAARRKEMFERRASGERMTDIAESFGMSRQTLSKDFTRAYKAYLEEEKAGAEVWRRFQTDRLEMLLRAVMPEALEGDVRASEQARKLIMDISTVNGWNSPVKAEISGPDGGPVALATGSLEDAEKLFNIVRPITGDDEDGDDEDDFDDHNADDDSDEDERGDGD